MRIDFYDVDPNIFDYLMDIIADKQTQDKRKRKSRNKSSRSDASRKSMHSLRSDQRVKSIDASKLSAHSARSFGNTLGAGLGGGLRKISGSKSEMDL